MPSTPAFFPPPDEVRRAAKAPWQWTEVWQPVGLCRMNSKIEWFPESAAAQRALTKTCTGCPVRKQCLTFALETGEHSGVWGGLTERELRKAAALTPQGTRRCSPGLNVCCPWCKGNENLTMTCERRVTCGDCGFDWPGMINESPEDEAASA